MDGRQIHHVEAHLSDCRQAFGGFLKGARAQGIQRGPLTAREEFIPGSEQGPAAVDFNGMGPLTLALMRDDAQLALSGYLSMKGQIDSKELHALAVLDSSEEAAGANAGLVAEARRAREQEVGIT